MKTIIKKYNKTLAHLNPDLIQVSHYSWDEVIQELHQLGYEVLTLTPDNSALEPLTPTQAHTTHH